MPAELESQLHELGKHLRHQTQHVGTDEIIERSDARAGDEPTGRTGRRGRLASSPLRARWPIAVAAALVLLLVGALLVTVPRSDDTGGVSDDDAALVLREDVSQRWSTEVPAVGDESIPLGPVALGSDVVVVAVGGQVTALDLADGAVRWQREYEDFGPIGAIADLTSFGETVVFTVGPRVVDDGADSAVIALSMTDGSELWRVSDGQGYAVLDGAVYEFDGLGSEMASFRLIDPSDGSYLTEALKIASRDGVATGGSLIIIENDEGVPTLYDTNRRRAIPFAFPAGSDLGEVTLALAGDDLVAVDGNEAALYDDTGSETDRLRLPEAVRDAPWITAFADRGLVVVSTGDSSAGIGVDDGKLAVKWESDAALNPSVSNPATGTDASSPLAVTAGVGFSQPGGVIDLDTGRALPVDGEPRWAYVAFNGYLAMTAGVGADDADTLRAYQRDGKPTWTLDVPAVTEGLEQSVLNDEVFILISVDRTDGTRLNVSAYA